MYNASLLTTGHFYRPSCERVLRAQLKETRVEKVHYRWHYDNRGIAPLFDFFSPTGESWSLPYFFPCLFVATRPTYEEFLFFFFSFFQRKNSVWQLEFRGLETNLTWHVIRDIRHLDVLKIVEKRMYATRVWRVSRFWIIYILIFENEYKSWKSEKCIMIFFVFDKRITLALKIVFRLKYS